MHKKDITKTVIEMYKYRAKVTRVVDSDTFDASVDVGFNITVNTRFRLKDIDMPKTELEREHSEWTIEYVKKLIEDKIVIIKTFKMGIYNKYNAIVILQDGSITTMETSSVA